MEFRKVFDTIPEQFDKYRPRYCAELFSDLIACAGIGPGKAVLELGQEQVRPPTPYLIPAAIIMRLNSVKTYMR